MNKTHYEAYVGNIGRIGEFPSKNAAKEAVRETIRLSVRADKHGFVCRCDDGEIVWEIGQAKID